MNMKPEIRNSKSETSPNQTNPNGVNRCASLGLNVCPSNFELASQFAFRNSDFPRSRRAFTLIELLIVIAIMAILAAMIIPISGAVTRNRMRAKARTELEQVATGIELYKAKLGHYPPDNPVNLATNQLYFELLGTTFSNGPNGSVYTTLDGSATVLASHLALVFGGPPTIGGIVNSSQGATSDESRSASSFLKGLKPGEVALIKKPGMDPTFDQVKILVSSAVTGVNTINPFCYVSSNPTNNPNGYDLWVDIVISGKTNRISNWNLQPIILP